MGIDFVKQHSIQTFLLQRPMRVFNIDGSPNNAGTIKRFACLGLTVDGYEHWVDFLVIDLGGEEIILGLPWLRRINPDIDWEKGQLTVNPRKVTVVDLLDTEGAQVGATLPSDGPILEDTRPTPQPSYEPTPPTAPPPQEPDDIPAPMRIRANHQLCRKWVRDGVLDNQNEETWCSAGFTYSQALAEKAHKAKPTRSFEELVLPQYHDFDKVFSEKELEQLPEHKPWDHAINLIPGMPETIHTKVYPM